MGDLCFEYFVLKYSSLDVGVPHNYGYDNKDDHNLDEDPVEILDPW